MDRPLTEAALAAVELASADPRRARIDARAVCDAARRNPEARTIAERALGLAAQELNDVEQQGEAHALDNVSEKHNARCIE